MIIATSATEDTRSRQVGHIARTSRSMGATARN
jgi:hypothetical protein